MHHRVLVLPILILLIALLAGPGSTRAQDATPPASGASILDAYGAAWSSGDAATVGALYTDDAVREDVPTGTTSNGKAEIEALATGLFKTDDDVRLDVTGGFAGETWAVVEWTFSGIRPETGYELTFRGASVLELENGLISRESDYYDLPELQQQMAAAGGTPAALETPAGATAATPDAATAAAQTGSVTIRVYSCPLALSQGEPNLATLQAGCAPLADFWAIPTVGLLPDGAPTVGMATAPGVYEWSGMAFGDYFIAGTGGQPAGLGGLRVTDALGMTLQNPVFNLDDASVPAEVSYFYFLTAATPAP